MQTFDILVVHRPPTSLTESFISLRGLLRPDHDGVLGKAVEVLIQHLLQSLSTSYEGDEHEDAPEDTEARQKRTRLIARQRVEYFSV